MSFSLDGRPARLILVALLAAASTGANAASEDLRLLPPALGTSERLLSEWRSGIGLDGYDPVTYLMEPAPRPGLPAHEAIWGGTAWRFASAANRAAFLRDPEMFLPRLGGYDAVAAAAGRLSAADPRIFVARGGRYYLFRTQDGRATFLRAAGAESEAEAGWAKLKSSLVLG